ncbi:putative ribosomal protein S12/S23 [Medicago truncatula]|uniref:Putative ribosomal protein S12/S23 n=1 Tax=Medicago truncatula TaxID=3880 RepID=A0A072VHV6_MEDTR|nr:ribosomal protein S12/S23 family protein [Medicago truncatula]RHN79155.1 putative ribosomal protein S12/S23 [Medicago truncatula]
MDECDIRILFATRRWLKISTALNETNSTTFEEDGWVYASKEVKSEHEDQRLEIIPSIMRIDITIVDIKAKQPNSAIRKGTKIQLIKNGKKIAAFRPYE